MLHELQSRMAAALLGTDPTPPTGLAQPRGGVPLDRRFGVHRATVAQSLTAVLAAAFPLAQTILGAGRFRALAEAFARQHPPTQAQLYAYGAGFPDWLARRPEGGRIAYLADMARVDWARHAAYFAADAPRLDPAGLAAGPGGDDPGSLAFTPHPAARLVVSRAPVASLAAALTGRAPDADTPIRLPDRGEALLVHRLDDGSVVDAPLTLIEGLTVAALFDGEPLATAAQVAEQTTPQGTPRGTPDDLDLQALLARLFQLGAFSAVTPPAEKDRP